MDDQQTGLADLGSWRPVPLGENMSVASALPLNWAPNKWQHIDLAASLDAVDQLVPAWPLAPHNALWVMEETMCVIER